MRKRISFLIGLLFTTFLFAQSEFAKYKNGLIYSEDTMHKLKKIVDSLNLKYKTCDLNKKFYSQQQTIGYLVQLKTGNVSQAKKDIDHNIPIEKFLAKYPEAIIKKNVLIIKSKTKNYYKKDIIRYNEVAVNDDYNIDIEKDYTKNLYHKPAKNTWVYYYRSKKSYPDETIDAFYFPENFKSTVLDQKYSKQIVYSDCLIDTSVTKFKENSIGDRYDFSVNASLPDDWRKLPKSEKEKLLDNLRDKQIVGNCSMDERPRIQGINMALLSADIPNWGLFLKSHLDIMNDRFERVSDSGYARQTRKTYIKELEELDINIYDLIFGTVFRIENPVDNHYYGSIDRLGKAISESRYKDDFLAQMLFIIEDENLDDYNRLISYFLYVNCNYYIMNERQKRINKIKLNNSIKKLPLYLSEQITPEEI
jgi:hypothetical protein